ncbi:MAG: S41 family peptidase [Chthoniobacterales bacterium]
MKLSSLGPVTVFLAFAPLLSIGAPAVKPVEKPPEKPADKDTAYDSMTVFARALELIRQDYVDEKKIAYKDLTYDALQGMLTSLDPHSQFLPPADFKDMQSDTKSEFTGLGIVVSFKGGLLTVVTPMEDSPSFKAGILPGDQILRIDGESTEKLELSEAINLLRGDPGKPIRLTISRASTHEIKDFDLIRTVIKVASIKDAKLVKPDLTDGYKIGYVRITQFNEPTAGDLQKELARLREQGMQALIVDLRHNPGGLLTSAVDVCSQFLSANQMVVYTEGRAASQRREYRTSGIEKPDTKTPLAVLVNSGSASGAEILAGALKDLNRAVIVGETTFGKGSVQSVIQMQDGSAVKLTTAKYYTPGRQVIHEHGITPTIVSTMTPEQERTLVMSRREDKLSLEEQANVENFDDPQMDRAIDALKGVLIYTQVAKLETKPEPAASPTPAE